MFCWGFGVAKTFIFWREGQKLFFLSLIKLLSELAVILDTVTMVILLFILLYFYFKFRKIMVKNKQIRFKKNIFRSY